MLDLLENAEKTEIPLVFKVRELVINQKLPWIIFLFGPSGVGKNSLAVPLIKKDLVTSVVTATSRERRTKLHEPEGAYLWMREKKEAETEGEYIQNLGAEYSLMEVDFHNNAVYGVPRKNLEAALKKKTVLLVIEINGVKTISRIMEGEANILRIFVVPDSLEQIKKRVKKRNDAEERIQKAIQEIEEAPDVADFYLQNPEGKLKEAQVSLEKLVIKYIEK